MHPAPIPSTSCYRHGGRVDRVVIGLQTALQREIALNLVLWCPAFLFLNWVNFLFLFQLQGVSDRSVMQIFLLATLHLLILVGALALIDAAVERTNRKSLQWGFGGLASLFLGAFYLDYLLFRTMSMHLGTVLRIFFEDGSAQFLLLIRATGLGSATLWRVTSGLLLLALAGGCLVRSTHWLDHHFRPMTFRLSRLLWLGAALLTAALVLDAARKGWAKDQQVWREQRRVMPFHIGFSQPSTGLKFPGAQLKALPSGPNLQQALSSSASWTNPPAFARPDLFIIVIESLREDYLDAQTAPNLSRFRQECLRFPDSIAAGNATHLSWYSLFTANYPLYVAVARHREGSWGSMPLRLLKAMGYEIHVLAASYLCFHRLDQIIFGRNLELATSLTDARHLSGPDSPEQDTEITEKLLEQLEAPPGGRLFILFYESTHHNYSWPKSFPAPFQPFAEVWHYTRVNWTSNELALIKNRYRNAVHYVDHCVGRLFEKLRGTGQYEQALVFVTGDHGEEFMEHGRMLHASEACRIQTHVPFYLKLPVGLHSSISSERLKLLPTASHLDLLPTLLDSLGVAVDGLCHGESLFRKPHNIVITAEQNGGRDPLAFCLQSGNLKGWFRYPEGRTSTALEQAVYLQKITDAADNIIELSPQEQRRVVGPAFGPALRKLYRNIQL